MHIDRNLIYDWACTTELGESLNFSVIGAETGDYPYGKKWNCSARTLIEILDKWML